MWRRCYLNNLINYRLQHLEVKILLKIVFGLFSRSRNLNKNPLEVSHQSWTHKNVFNASTNTSLWIIHFGSNVQRMLNCDTEKLTCQYVVTFSLVLSLFFFMFNRQVISFSRGVGVFDTNEILDETSWMTNIQLGLYYAF